MKLKSKAQSAEVLDGVLRCSNQGAQNANSYTTNLTAEVQRNWRDDFGMVVVLSWLASDELE